MTDNWILLRGTSFPNWDPFWPQQCDALAEPLVKDTLSKGTNLCMVAKRWLCPVDCGTPHHTKLDALHTIVTAKTSHKIPLAALATHKAQRKACYVNGNVLDAAQVASRKTDDKIPIGLLRTQIVWELWLEHWHGIICCQPWHRRALNVSWIGSWRSVKGGKQMQCGAM